MTKTAQGQNTAGEYKKRLQEIAEVQFGTLSDDEVLRFLAERKRLSDMEREYEKVQKEEAIRLEREKKEEDLKAAEKKKTAILKKIEELNKSISGEVPDDDLLALVAQRKELEKELEESGGGTLPQKEEILPLAAPLAPAAPDVLPEKDLGEPETEGLPTVPKEERKARNGGEKKTVTDESLSREPKDHIEEEYGNEKISDTGIEEGAVFQRYFDQLKNNVGSLGTLLQNMPLDAKKNKAFMLRVARIDPAYAMHFADKDTLKKDEDFNLRIASLDNPRNSGNALAEMLPEARTSKVLLAAVKQDYRNVRFIQPHMADYDEMMSIAKRGALDKVKNLKEATDILLLIPKPLQQDKQFMLQVKEVTGSKKPE